MSAGSVSVHTNKPEKRWEGGKKQQQTRQPFFSPLPVEPPPSPSVSETLRVPPPANKAIRDGKDADTVAFERHSEQKRKRRGRQRGIGRGLNGVEGREEVSVVVVNQKCKPTLCC